MYRWKDRVAVVTGASAGIGVAIVKDLLKSGLKVVGLARREEKIHDIGNSLSELRSRLYPIKCDITKEDDIKNSFQWIEKNLGGVDILINNAGIMHTTDLVSLDNTKQMKETVDTNLMGVVYCTREAFNSMKSRNFDGHIVIVNSYAGHKVPVTGNQFPSLNIYPATKFSLTALTENYRQEFLNHNTKIKITSISPGLVKTDIFPDNIKDIIEMVPGLSPEDISSAILYAIGTPPHVQVHELIIKPIGELQ